MRSPWLVIVKESHNRPHHYCFLSFIIYYSPHVFLPTVDSSTGTPLTSLAFHVNMAARIQLSRLGRWRFLSAGKSWAASATRTILPRCNIQDCNSSICRQIIEHADVQEVNWQVRLRTIHFSFLIFITIKAQVTLSSTVNESAPRASRAGHMN